MPADIGEDELLEAALNNETAQLRQIYHATEYFQSDDSLFAYWQRRPHEPS